MKKTAIFILSVIILALGIYNFPKGPNPIFSWSKIDVPEAIRRIYFHSQGFVWKDGAYRDAKGNIAYELKNENEIKLYPNREPTSWDEANMRYSSQQTWIKWGKLGPMEGKEPHEHPQNHDASSYKE